MPIDDYSSTEVLMEDAQKFVQGNNQLATMKSCKFRKKIKKQSTKSKINPRASIDDNMKRFSQVSIRMR